MNSQETSVREWVLAAIVAIIIVALIWVKANRNGGPTIPSPTVSSPTSKPVQDKPPFYPCDPKGKCA